VWVTTGLALLGAMAAAAGEARAGITVGGGFQPTKPDPQFEYLFFLQSTVEIDQGFSFTVNDLVSPLSSAESPDDWRVTVCSAAGSATWTYVGEESLFDDSDDPHQLGGFNVFTGNLIPGVDPFPTAGTTINYSYTLTPGSTPVTASFQLQAIPEPSSALIVLVVGSTAGGYGLVARAWRRRPGRAR
jgi:hypothetical protein